MTIATFSVPIDVPWTRIAFSDDMMDKVACDRELPLRWRSSVAVFEYEPPDDQQRIDGFKVSYLKVACSITGYQPNGKEIRIRERLGRSGWKSATITGNLQETVSAYYACYGAMLEVVVAPHPDDRRFGLASYPYFADFDPKKRELYEVVTETGEVMSRSLEDVNVRTGRTTLQSHEVRDTTTLSASLSGSYAGVTAAGSVSNTAGTVDLTQQGTENIRTTDAAREARETFSHTTQLSQMYHQLNSYHLGTNRAAFFVLPRPHVVQTPSTFVNGPREIEGIQEFMLVVVRPKEMETYCVEAYLETAHLTRDPVLDWDETSTQLHLPMIEPTTPEDEDHASVKTLYDTASTPLRVGYVVDTNRGAGGYDDAGSRGYDVLSINAVGDHHFRFIVDSDHVTVNGDATAIWSAHPPIRYISHVEVDATVYLKRKAPLIGGYRDGLLITGRAVCSCSGARLVAVPYDNGIHVVYEKEFATVEKAKSREREPMAINEANRMGAEIHRELLQSLSSVNRYPRGAVGFLDTQHIARTMGAHIRDAGPDVNARLADWPGVDERLAHRVAAYAPSMTRAQMLEMPLVEQVETLGLSFEETVELRRALQDIDEPKGPPPIPERITVRVPLLAGLQFREARGAIMEAGLRLTTAAEVDSPLPTGTVVEQTPDAGATVESGTNVSITVASGLSVRLADVVGLGLLEAACRLRDGGLRGEPTVEGKALPDARVVELDPPAGTLVSPLAAVTIRLKR